jgi:hypothetical protein
MLNPRLTNGWNELRDTYNLTSCHKLHIEFIGDNFFNVQIDYSTVHSNIIPPFHSFSTAPIFHTEFQVKLLKSPTMHKFLVCIHSKYFKLFNLHA